MQCELGVNLKQYTVEIAIPVFYSQREFSLACAVSGYVHTDAYTDIAF